jgi:predicted MFS family arabinose efflux permease
VSEAATKSAKDRPNLPRGDGVLVTWRESPRAVKALLAGIFVNKLGGFVQVFLVLFMTERGFGAVQAGLALGAYGAGSVVGVVLGGSISDRIGARWAIAASMLATSGLLVAVLYVRLYPALLTVVTLVGAVSQVYRPASAALLAELTPRRRQVMVFAMSRLALNLGTTAAPLLGVALLTVSYNLLFWGEALAALSYAVITILLVPTSAGAADPAAADPAAANAAPADAAPADAARPEPAQGVPVRGGYLAVLADRRYTMYLVAMLVNAAVYMQYVSTLPLAVRDAGLKPFWYSVMVSLNGFVVITCELLMTKVVSRWPARRVLAVGFTLLGAGLACYAVPGGVAIFILGTLTWSLAEIIEGPTMFAYPAQAGPPRLRGRYIGAAHGMFGLGSALGPVLGVALWSGVGSAIWIICGAASVLALLPGLYGINPRLARD